MLGRYELLFPIGRGGMAEVFLARRRGPGGVEKRLVVKRIRRERSRDPRFVEMFVGEARLSMSLSHKNVVPVFDFGRAGDELFLVMEYVEGANLGAALAADGVPLEPALVAFVGIEACQALDYAHGRGVIHRDVTPANVLLSRAGEVKLADFGVATAETDLGAGGRVRGTPAYMAPEQARGEAMDARSEVFALGLVLWETLAGRRAYDGADVQAQLARARAGDVPALDERVPAALRAVIERATRADPEARFASVRAMQLALDDYLVATRAAAAGKPPPMHALASWLRARIPEEPREIDDDAVTPPRGRVETFLDDGFATAAEAGDTARSVAETIADDAPPVVEPPAAPPPATPGPLAPARGRRGVVVLALTGAAAAALIAAGVLVGSSPAPTPVASATPPDAGALDASPPDATPATDAAVATPTDAAVAGASADARSAATAPTSRGDAASAAAPADLPPRPSLPPGTVRVSAEPGWAEVRVAGRPERCSQTPCSLSLPPGHYRLELENPYSGLTGTHDIDVASDAETLARVTLRAD